MFTLRYQGGRAVPASDIWPGAADGEQWACNHASTGRAEASSLAARVGQAVEVLRAGKVAYIMLPNGSTRPPSDAISPERGLCVRDSGQACFCQPCRDERKAQR